MAIFLDAGHTIIGVGGVSRMPVVLILCFSWDLQLSPSARPLIVYFPDPKQWFERAVPSSQRKEFLERVEAKLDQLEGPIVLIASRINEEEVDYDDKNRLVSFFLCYYNFCRRAWNSRKDHARDESVLCVASFSF